MKYNTIVVKNINRMLKELGMGQLLEANEDGYVTIQRRDYRLLGDLGKILADTSELIVNNLVDVRGREFNVRRVDGEIVTKVIDNQDILCIVASLVNEHSKMMSDKEYRDILLGTNIRLTECGGDYYDFNETVGQWIMKNKPNTRIIRLLALRDRFSSVGNTVETVKRYIKEYNSLEVKKNFILSNEEISEYGRDFVMGYIKNDIYNRGIKDEVRQKDISEYKSDRGDIYVLAVGNNISEVDLDYRVKRGMSIDEAIEIGIEEREKYNLENEYTLVTTHTPIYKRTDDASICRFYNIAAKLIERGEV